MTNWASLSREPREKPRERNRKGDLSEVTGSVGLRPLVATKGKADDGRLGCLILAAVAEMSRVSRLCLFISHTHGIVGGACGRTRAAASGGTESA